MGDNRFERKLLHQTLCLLRGQDSGLKRQRLVILVLYLIGGAILAAAYLLTVWSKIDQRLGVLLAAAGGNLIAIAAYMGVCSRQWPLLKPHLRIETIEERLREIEA